jgi:hypothetical protein
MDEFNFGAPGRRGPRVGLDPRVLVAVGVLLAVGLAVYGFLTFVSEGGHEVAEAQVSAVQQVDHSQDAAVQTNLRTAMVAAKTQFATAGTYEGLTPADLAGLEPTFTYTDGPSGDISTISVAASATSVGMAAMSSSGTCFLIRDDAVAGLAYGSGGTTCTGRFALLSVAGSSW